MEPAELIRSPAFRARMRETVGDADGAVLPARVESAAHAEPARFRELCARVRGLEPLPAHRAEFAWVVAALRARTDR